MNNVDEIVQDVVAIVEQYYLLQKSETARKLANIRRIKLDMLTDLIKQEVDKKNIKTKADIIKHVESIIQD